VGHLAAAEAARSAYRLDGVVFVPAARPPHKEGQVQATALQRYVMVVLAVAGDSSFSVSRLELDRPGPSYTVDTLRSLRERHPGDTFWFITGADSICALASWHRAEELLDLAEFVAVSRTGFPRGRVAEFAARLPERHRRRLHYLETPVLDIASHDLRRRVAAGESVRYLVPPPVAAYIEAEGLYRPARPDRTAPIRAVGSRHPERVAALEAAAGDAAAVGPERGPDPHSGGPRGNAAPAREP
jgi:nicotinate-nucleotide adenylyltransferase